ncbi:ATP-dependent nuclease [Fusobacterium varium]|uniref:ATP-dependent nuclease n=1 Tax=Fusobacterium varium TaxID=856 RepID=UPI002FE4DCBE
MYIKELEIENFRGFGENTKIEFQDGINVLIGPNNGGKTTILKALELLFSSGSNKKLKIEDFNQNIKIEELKKHSPKIKISAILSESEKEENYSDDLISISTWLIKIEKPYQAQITFEYSLPETYEKDYIEYMAKVKDESENRYIYWKEIENEFLRKYTSKIYIGNPEYKNIIDSESLKTFDFQFLTAIRDVERDLFSGGNTQLKEIIDFFMDYNIKTDNSLDKQDKINEIKKLKIKFSEDASVLIDSLQSRMEQGKKEILKYVENVGTNVEKITPNFDGRLLDTELYSALKLVIELETGIKLPATRNGLGYNNLLFISLLLAKMQKDSSKEYLGSNAKNFSILAFEEPEAHLHPNMQYKLLKFLGENIKNEVRQIFITTHSPNITSKVNLDSLIVLTKLNNEIKISYPGKVFNGSVEAINSKKYIERFLDVTKADMFFAKNLIFVEGLAEQLLLPIFAKKLGISLEDNHISIINVNGRYFEHFIKLFNTDTSKFAIPKKVVCITDQDPVKKNKIEENWEKCHSFEINLEKENYEYRTTSNKTLENSKDLNKDFFYIATQKEGSTFEYEMLLENYKSSFFITGSVANKELLREMMKNVERIKNNDDLLEEVNKFNKSKLKDLQIKYIENSEENIQQKAKHIIASRYLASIGKGEVAQELATILNEDIEFNVPSYIKEALKWLC